MMRLARKRVSKQLQFADNVRGHGRVQEVLGKPESLLRFQETARRNAEHSARLAARELEAVQTEARARAKSERKRARGC